MRLPTENDADTLENLIDEIGLEEVTNILAAICAMKAEHIMQSYQDKTLAARWNDVGADLSTAADSAANL